MRPKLLIFALIFSLGINAAVLVTTGYHYYRNTSLTPSVPCPLSPGDSHLYQSLGLSTLQLAKMEPIAKTFHARLEKLGATMEEKKVLLVDLLSQKEVDPDRIEGLRKEMAGIQDEIQREVITHIIESNKILDSQQQQRFFDLIHQSMARVQGK